MSFKGNKLHNPNRYAWPIFLGVMRSYAASRSGTSSTERRVPSTEYRVPSAECLIVAAAGNDLTDPAARVGHVTGVAGNQVDVKMPDGLAGGDADVEADVRQAFRIASGEGAEEVIHEYVTRWGCVQFNCALSACTILCFAFSRLVGCASSFVSCCRLGSGCSAPGRFS